MGMWKLPSKSSIDSDSILVPQLKLQYFEIQIICAL